MRRGRLAVVSAAAAAILVLAGCGEQVPDVDDVAAPSTQPAVPDSAAPGPTSEDAAVVRRLRRAHPSLAPRGTVVVVDVLGRDLTGAPAEIEFAKDGTLTGLRWTGWGSREAIGHGRARLLECAPSCSRGRRSGAPGTIRLTRLQSCAGRRFYDAAEVTFGEGDAISYARAYIGAPC